MNSFESAFSCLANGRITERTVMLLPFSSNSASYEGYIRMRNVRSVYIEKV
jgi:hypothetical protein